MPVPPERPAGPCPVISYFQVDVKYQMNSFIPSFPGLGFPQVPTHSIWGVKTSSSVLPNAAFIANSAL